MFRESLLDSSPSRRNRKRWPMATAFVLESIAAALIIIVPLLSTGVIPVSARVPRVAPLQAVRVASEPVRDVAGGRSSSARAATSTVIAVRNNTNAIPYGSLSNSSYDRDTDSQIPYVPSGPGPEIAICTDCQPIAPPAPKRVISHSMEALLVHRVEPFYPRTAVLINLQGEVRLHAIIGKDGTIQSLSVTSGHPILAQAALDAVRQWRYRPYVLNGEPVEVETLITVNFKRDR
jgi:periplasmic protein TonB